MNALQILPAMIRSRSLSRDEIVLNHIDAIRAIEALMDFGYAVTGWEGWLVRTKTDYDISTELQAEFDTRMDGEAWDAYVRRTAQLARTALMDAQRIWMNRQTDLDVELYFCLKTAR
jgi:hypothetical protein